MNPDTQDSRGRTYCRQHCKGFRETGGLCFADGACEKYTQYMKKKQNAPKDESLPEGHC